MRVTFITSYYQGERYLRRFLFCARRLRTALGRAGHESIFAVAVNAARARERRRWEQAAQHLPLALHFTERETVYASWNRLLQTMASGEIYLIWNMDDWRWNRGALEQIRLLAEAGARPRIVVSRHQAWQMKWWPLYVRWHAQRPADRHSPTPFLSFNRAVWERVGPFLEAFQISGDKEWYYRAQTLGVEVQFSPVSAGVLYHADVGLSTSADPRRICENLVIQEMYPDLNQLHYGYYRTLREQVRPEIQRYLSEKHGI